MVRQYGEQLPTKRLDANLVPGKALTMKCTAAPLIRTERLVLRAHTLAGFDRFAAFYRSERSQYADGPVSKERAWDWFVAGAGRWPLLGFGAWAIERAEDGAYVGIVSLNHPVADGQERELGWLLWDGFEGHGFATEAARAAKAYAIDTLNWSSFVSYISKDNHSSIRLAERLGAYLDSEATITTDLDTLVFRHLPREE